MSAGGLGRRLFVGVGILSLLVILAGGVSIWIGAAMKGEFDLMVRETARNLTLAQDIEIDAVMLQLQQRRMLLSALGADTAELADARTKMTQARESVAGHVRDLLAMAPTDEFRARLASTDAKLKAWDETDARVQQLIASNDTSGAWEVVRKTSAPLLDAVRADAGANSAELGALAARAARKTDSDYTFLWRLQIAMLLLSLPVTLAVTVGVRRIASALRDLSGRLGENAEHVASAAAQVASASQELSRGANEQASSIGDTSSAMAKMTASVRRSAESSQSVAAMTSEAASLIGATNEALRGMVTSMSAIKTSSDKVARIIKTIDEIAFQTNILALNAAVEAARAGEAGMGFAVVADEVRNLAQRSAHAAKDTATLIEESIARADEGYERVEQVARAVAEVSASATRIQHVIESVSAASREQIHEIEQVTRAVAEIERVTQSTAASAEEHAAVGQEIAAQAAAAMAVVRNLTLLVEGTEAAGAAAAAARPTNWPRVVSMVPKRAPEAAYESDAHPGQATGTFGRF